MYLLDFGEVAKISATALSGMTTDAVKSALKTLGQVDQFDKKQTKELATKVAEAYPVVEDWTEETIEEVCYYILQSIFSLCSVLKFRAHTDFLLNLSSMLCGGDRHHYERYGCREA